MPQERSTRFPGWLLVGLSVFALVLLYLIISSLTSRTAPMFDLSPVGGTPVRVGRTLVDTVTIDARKSDTWTFFDFERAEVLQLSDTVGWDLAFRRFNVMSSGELADLGAVEFESVATAPLTGYTSPVVGADTVDAPVGRWYRYSILSHLLRPTGHVYVLRTEEGAFAKFELVSYYCTGMVAGCVTFRYVYQPQPGVRDFS